MDPVTHALAGAVLAQAGFRQRYGHQATLAMIGGALLPDIDVFWSPARDVVALETHRGITHSLVGAVGLALALGLLLRALGPVRRWGLLSALSLLGIVGGHLFLDLINSYGIQLFLPFSRARPSLDLVYIVDPFLALPLLAALIAGLFWRRASARVAQIALLVVIVYLGFMGASRFAALTSMDHVLRAQGVTPRRVDALPWPLNPLRWQGVAEDSDKYWTGEIRPWQRDAALTQIPKGPENGPVARARERQEVRTFLWFARFPVVASWEEGSYAVVEYRDLRFSHSLRGRPPFVLRVMVSPAGEVERVLFNP